MESAMEDTQKLDYFQKLKNKWRRHLQSSVQSQQQISICGSEKNSETRNYYLLCETRTHERSEYQSLIRNSQLASKVS